VEEPNRRGVRVAMIGGRVFLALVSAAALVAAGVAWTRLNRLSDSLNTTDALVEVEQQSSASASPQPKKDDGADDILLVGSDSRTDMQGLPLTAEQLRELRTEASDGLNTDTIILIRIPHGGGKSYAISIPRDTYVSIPGRQPDKVNSVYGVRKYAVEQELRGKGVTDRAAIEKKSAQAGQAALVQTVQNLTGVRVDHYAEISLYGFYLLTEAVGGVEVCLNHATVDPDSGANFRSGPQTVTGSDAVAFVRQRKNLPRGDLDRIVRQQTFLASAMRKMLSAGTLTSSGKLNALADAVNKSVVTDGGLKLIDLVEQAQSLASGNVGFVTIPVTSGNAHNSRGQSIVSVAVPKVRDFVAGLVGHKAAPSAPMTTPTDVSDGPPPPKPTTTTTGTGLAGKHLLALSAGAPRCVD
jgi:LCP family protein required for cell wall assembly